MATASNWTWNFLIAFFTPFITADIDFALGYVFAGCNLVAGTLVYFFVIEGQGRTLEEMDTMYLERIDPPKPARWVPPPAGEMARTRRDAGLAEDDVMDSDKEKRSSDNSALPTNQKVEEEQAEHV